MKVPDRWLKYKNSFRIRGTRFVAFKVPLKEGYSRSIPRDKCFTPETLRQNHPNIKLIIDLTFTWKYYNGKEEFEKRGIKYIKIRCKGHDIPNENCFKQFAAIVDEFLKTNPEDFLIGVHCTHGVNRTGYLIVRYMIEKLGYSATNSLRDFLRSRGHAIERTNYIADLLRRDSKSQFERPRMNKKA